MAEARGTRKYSKPCAERKKRFIKSATTHSSFVKDVFEHSAVPRGNTSVDVDTHRLTKQILAKRQGVAMPLERGVQVNQKIHELHEFLLRFDIEAFVVRHNNFVVVGG